MKIGSRSIVFIWLVNAVRGDNSDAEWESERIMKINRQERRTIGLASEDSERQPRRWNSEKEIEDRARPFASYVLERAERREEDSPEEHFRNDKRVSNVEKTLPSPILLPPYDFDPPAYRNVIFDSGAPSPWKNESYAGKSNGTTPLTTLNSSTKERTVENEPHRYRDGSDWMRELVRESSVNVTKTSSEERSIEKVEPYLSRSFYIDEESSVTATRKSNIVKNSRGNRKYQRDRFESERTLTRKRTFPSSGRYDRPTAQRSNHFKFIDDPYIGKVGSVPGVPGRDYPVHQEHTHHRLRNVVDRFPCPRTSKSHVYLADRASRCQIFYVCYGSNTGVPMVCPNGTLFSEPLQVCDWWFNVAC